MNCFVCGKEKQDFEVWSNKLVIGITFDSDFQKNDIISSMSEKSIHNMLRSVRKGLNLKEAVFEKEWPTRPEKLTINKPEKECEI